MNFSVKLRSEAQKDIEESAKWYEQQRENLGFDFLDEIDKSCLLIEHDPLMYEEVYKNLRRVVVERFPFNIFYFVEEESIVIVAVIHGSRHPKKWQKRI